MQKYNIDLNSILQKGQVIKEIKDDMLYVTTTRRVTENIYVYLPNNYKLPLRIDLSIKIDSPEFCLFFGKGHLNFGSLCSENRRIDDIIEPNSKPRFFHNYIPMNQFVDISIIYGLNVMQILINGEERFYSKKEKYMKSKLLDDLNKNGFTLKMTCTKRTNLVIKALSITEYDDSVEVNHTESELPKPLITNTAIEPEQKPKFEMCLALLPEEIRNEIIKTDNFLRSLRPLKFKRQIEKYGNKITYLASKHGFSYIIYPSNDVMHHALSWYIITNGKPELWHRKADMMEATLNKLEEAEPDLAERMFFNLTECNACCKCLVKTLYEFRGIKKITCHGRMDLKMSAPDFMDVRTFINTVNQLVIEA